MHKTQDGEGLRRSRTENVCSNSARALDLRECTQRAFWEIFVDDRPFCVDALPGTQMFNQKPYSILL